MGNSGSYSEPSQISKTEFFMKLVNLEKSLAIFIKSSISCAGLGSEYTSIIIEKMDLLHLCSHKSLKTMFIGESNFS